MKITPLVLHGYVNIPRWTSLFSEALPVSTIVVVAGGNTVINCSAPHGVAVSGAIGVSITDAETPNAISAAVVQPDGDILITTASDHDLTMGWVTSVHVEGFTSASINGTRLLVDVPSPRQFVLRPGGVVASITLNGAEKLLEHLEAELTGWHAVQATSATALTFATPASVTRSYTVLTPVVVRSMKIFGARDPDAAERHYTENGAKKAAMFVCPESSVMAERVGGKGENGAGVDYRQRLADGFSVVIFLPSADTAAHVRCIDQAQGEVFKAVLRTFLGLQLDRSELIDAGGFSTTLHAHGSANITNNAVYVHKYDFHAPAMITNADGISPWNWSQIDDAAVTAGTPVTSVQAVGAPALKELDFTGILHDGLPTPLTGTFTVQE